MGGGESQLREATRKSTVNKGMVVTQLSIIAFPTERSFYRFGHLPLPGPSREIPLQMEISLVNVNVPYERVASAKFSELFLCLMFLKINQLKIIVMPKRHILG